VILTFDFLFLTCQSMNRTLIKDTPELSDKEVTVSGWVDARRDHGKLIFIDLRDRTGLLQVVFNPQVSSKAHAIAQNLKNQDVLRIKGKVNKRPDRMVNPKIVSGTVELEATDVVVLAAADTLPFDMGGETLNVELPTLLDHRSLTLKHEAVRMIFSVQAALVDEFRKAATALDCTEIFVPTIAAGATEGGAEVFTVDYYGRKAFMTQSPQLYKQIMVGVFERVFTIAKAYRAEPSVTTRHLAEATQMDVEIGFIESFDELLDALEFVGSNMIKNVSEKYPEILERFKVEKPLVPNKIPRLTLREAQKIVTERTGRDLSKEMDLNPEDEREICVWANEEKQSDFVTITHFPMKKRPFYTMADPNDPEYSLSYDLLFRGLEILSGSQRVHDYQTLIAKMKEKGVDPKDFGMYLMAFQFGMPPEGGFSFGLERLTMKLLNLPNVREASLFPRDMERVDERLSEITQNAKDKK
jgi:nondiscriminating aspartyl-tRNA synthetase